MIVHTLSHLVGYRLALLIMYPGELILSKYSVSGLILTFLLDFNRTATYGCFIIFLLCRCCFLLSDVFTAAQIAI